MHKLLGEFCISVKPANVSDCFYLDKCITNVVLLSYAYLPRAIYFCYNTIVSTYGPEPHYYLAQLIIQVSNADPISMLTAIACRKMLHSYYRQC